MPGGGVAGFPQRGTGVRRGNILSCVWGSGDGGTVVGSFADGIEAFGTESGWFWYTFLPHWGSNGGGRAGVVLG